MATAIYVGKNVARILDREFPIDNDLTMVKADVDLCGWDTVSSLRRELFTPIIDGEVSAEAFRTYNVALQKSVAFNHRGKMRKLFEKKEEGVKIIPGHGVFILPSKMRVVQRGPRKVVIKVFTGTSQEATFDNSDYALMVEEAACYYSYHFKEFTDEVNESLWFPVKYRRAEERTIQGLVIPEGIQARMSKFNTVEIFYYSPEEHQGVRFGTARNIHELETMLAAADGQRDTELKRAAMYRYVHPSYVPFSNYMRRISGV